MFMFTNIDVCFTLVFCVSRPVNMTESSYFPTNRLTRSQMLSDNKVSELSERKSCSSRLSGMVRKRPNIKTEESKDCYNNSHTNDTIEEKCIKSEGSKVKDDIDESSVKRDRWEPPVWRCQLENINEMRKSRDAPVDTMGCDVISDALASPQVTTQSGASCSEHH